MIGKRLIPMVEISFICPVDFYDSCNVIFLWKILDKSDADFTHLKVHLSKCAINNVLDCIDLSLTVYLSHLSAELHPTQLIPPHTLYSCAE